MALPATTLNPLTAVPAGIGAATDTIQTAPAAASAAAPAGIGTAPDTIQTASSEVSAAAQPIGVRAQLWALAKAVANAVSDFLAPTYSYVKGFFVAAEETPALDMPAIEPLLAASVAVPTLQERVVIALGELAGLRDQLTAAGIPEQEQLREVEGELTAAQGVLAELEVLLARFGALIQAHQAELQTSAEAPLAQLQLVKASIDSGLTRGDVVRTFKTLSHELQELVKLKMWELAEGTDRANADNWAGRIIDNQIQLPDETRVRADIERHTDITAADSLFVRALDNRIYRLSVRE